jgi:hypothetical protein
MAATNKCLAQINKSRTRGKATKEREIWQPTLTANVSDETDDNYHFTELQIALVMRAQPNCHDKLANEGNRRHAMTHRESGQLPTPLAEQLRCSR